MPAFPLSPPPEPPAAYQGIWYYNQKQDGPYHYKYSGGFAFYPQQMAPLAVYAPAVNKTFFVFGGTTDGRQIHNMVAYYDHATGLVSRPHCLLTRGTFDAHYNATLAIDGSGYLWVFCNSHGEGFELKESDPTYGKAYVFRSDAPYSIEKFTETRVENFSYSQVWPLPDGGFFWFHTRYKGSTRGLFWSRSTADGTWSTPGRLAHIEKGNYQISWAQGNRLATAFDFHPDPVGLNARTNIYYIETPDAGKTWRTADGREITLPLVKADNPALVHDFRSAGELVYLKDLTFDNAGRPVILYITSRGPWSGPENGPRHWWIAQWDGAAWQRRQIGAATHNYDHGSLIIEKDGTWRWIAPTLPGPQPDGTGGQVTMQTSRDEGRTWKTEVTFPIFDGLNQTYVRRPLGAHEGFYAFWADGNAYKPSPSRLYFCDREGRLYRLPPVMQGESAAPEAVYQPDLPHE